MTFSIVQKCFAYILPFSSPPKVSLCLFSGRFGKKRDPCFPLAIVQHEGRRLGQAVSAAGAGGRHVRPHSQLEHPWHLAVGWEGSSFPGNHCTSHGTNKQTRTQHRPLPFSKVRKKYPVYTDICGKTLGRKQRAELINLHVGWYFGSHKAKGDLPALGDRLQPS